MSDPVIRTEEGAEERISLAWDTVWVPFDPVSGAGGFFDWYVSDKTLEPRNAGGFGNQDELASAIQNQLFTDLRRPDWLDIGEARRQGWAGDTFDIDADAGERPAGSLLWTLRRGDLSEETRQKAVVYATEALQTFLVQGACSKFDITAEASPTQGYLILRVTAFASSGKSIFSNEYPLR